MAGYVIVLLKSGEIEAKKYLIYNDLFAEWYTDWVYGKGYVTRIIFEKQSDAIEFQLKFSDNIDYSLM